MCILAKLSELKAANAILEQHQETLRQAERTLDGMKGAAREHAK